MSKNIKQLIVRAYNDSLKHIKFRGNLIDTGEVVYGGFFQHSKVLLSPVGVTEEDIKNNNEYLIATTVKDEEGRSSVKMYEVSPGTVGMYTNYYDKNNVDIYTGDSLFYVDGIYTVTYRQGRFYLEGKAETKLLRGLDVSKLHVLRDRPVQLNCLNLDFLDIKAKALHNDTWCRGGCSYDEGTEQMDILLSSGVCDWNLPVPIRATRVQPSTVCVSLGMLDKEGKTVYLGDILEFTKDTVYIKKGTRAVIIMLQGEFCLYAPDYKLYLSNSLCMADDKLLDALVVGNIHDLEGLG